MQKPHFNPKCLLFLIKEFLEFSPTYPFWNFTSSNWEESLKYINCYYSTKYFKFLKKLFSSLFEIHSPSFTPVFLGYQIHSFCRKQLQPGLILFSLHPTCLLLYRCRIFFCIFHCFPGLLDQQLVDDAVIHVFEAIPLVLQKLGSGM